MDYSLAIRLDVMLEGTIMNKLTALTIIFSRNYSLAGCLNILKLLRDKF